MPWIGPAISVAGGLLGGSSSGGGTQTVNKDPWAPAQDWMKSNITSGQNLQAQYAANPFSQYQQQAYGNSRNLSQGAQSLLGSLIPQMSGHQGFDRGNPMQKPQGYNFMPQGGPPPGGPQGGPPQNLGMGGMGPSVSAAAAPAPAAPAAPSMDAIMAEMKARQDAERARIDNLHANRGR